MTDRNPHTPSQPSDRRRQARTVIVRPMKLRCAATGKYYLGRTYDASGSGMMVEIDHPSLLVVGQNVQLGVAWSNRHMLLNSQHMLHATVLRSLGTRSRQRVAVRFDTPQQLVLAG